MYLTDCFVYVCRDALRVLLQDDDGDFDDLYGNPPNKRAGSRVTTAAAGSQYRVDAETHTSKQPQALASGRNSVDGGAYSYPVSPVSTTHSRSDAGDAGVSQAGAVTPGGRASDVTNRRATKQALKQKAKAAKAKSAQSSSKEAAADVSGAREQNARQRKGSEELFNVDWEDDDAVKACYSCASSFSLMKRKHHCRYVCV